MCTTSCIIRRFCVVVSEILYVFGADLLNTILQFSVSQPLDRGPVPGSGINYTGPREILLELFILVF